MLLTPLRYSAKKAATQNKAGQKMTKLNETSRTSLLNLTFTFYNLQAHLTFIKTNCQQFKVTILIQNLLAKIIVDFTLCTLCVNLNFSSF